MLVRALQKIVNTRTDIILLYILDRPLTFRVNTYSAAATRKQLNFRISQRSFLKNQTWNQVYECIHHTAKGKKKLQTWDKRPNKGEENTNVLTFWFWHTDDATQGKLVHHDCHNVWSNYFKIVRFLTRKWTRRKSIGLFPFFTICSLILTSRNFPSRCGMTLGYSKFLCRWLQNSIQFRCLCYKR